MKTRLTAMFAAMLLPTYAKAEVEVVTQKEPDVLELREHSEGELVDDEGYVLRLSMPTEEDAVAWRQPGFRFGLGWIQGRQWGQGPSPELSPLGAAMRLSLRVSEEWSLGAAFSWQVLSSGLNGLKWGASLEPTWHPWKGLALSLGLGYGGLMGNRTQIDETEWKYADSTISQTLADDELLYDCQAGGAYALARVEYQFVVGPLFSTGPFAQLDAQRTGCESTMETDEETGHPITHRQWWTHTGFNLGWWATWR